MQLPVTQRPLTPPGTNGYYDIPFIYAKNYFIPKAGAGSNPGIDGGGFYASSWQDVLASQGDYEFRLRRHVPSEARNFNFLDAASKSLYSPLNFNPNDISAASNLRGDVLLQQDMVYPPGAGIRVINSNGFQFHALDNFWAGFYYFQGVKRIYRAPNTTPNYPYQERSFTYELPFSLAQAYPWTTSLYVPVLNYDFEFQALFYSVGYGNVPFVPSGTIGFQARIYDAGRFAMMSDYVDIETLTISGGIGPTGCFPTPPVIYPRGSQIQIDIQSTALAADVPASVTLNLVGVNRVPC